MDSNISYGIGAPDAADATIQTSTYVDIETDAMHEKIDGRWVLIYLNGDPIEIVSDK